MRISRASLTWIQAIALVLALAGLILLFWTRRRTDRSDAVVPHTYQLVAARAGEWQSLGGMWEIADGAVRSHSNERGAKLLTGSKAWRDYTVTADIRFQSRSADMGLIVRSNNEAEGIFAFDGYYVGLRSLDDTLVIGRANYGWAEARPVPMPGGVHPSEQYRLQVTTFGCNVAASATNLTTLQTAWIAFEERSCIRSGRIGLRSLNAQGEWRNVSVGSASHQDYVGLQQHAASVERPVILNGPPWWTAWHITLLFAGALTLALLVQLGYFRIQQWKAYAIMQERDRLAHEVHETMAQSFAGVGYQIQGIRSSLLRGDPHDLDQIPEKLTVAYQLVRRCHEDASRTIAMLSQTSSTRDQSLLQALASAASKMAGERFQIVKQIHGNPTRLSLQMSDALLQVGREAILNAVNHSKATVLTITLRFQESLIELIVEDNGQGFDYKTYEKGLGILAMEKRVRGVSGTLEIRSGPRHGTRVVVTVPSADHWLRRWLLPTARFLRS